MGRSADFRGGTDYYGRFLHLPADHPDNNEGFDDEADDDGDLTRCECVTGCEPEDFCDEVA
jgi:hypothetical protein